MAWSVSCIWVKPLTSEKVLEKLNLNFLIIEEFAGEAALLAGSGWLQLWGVHSQDFSLHSPQHVWDQYSPAGSQGLPSHPLPIPLQLKLMEQPQCTLRSLHVSLPYLSRRNSLIVFYTSWEHGAGQTCSELCACPLPCLEKDATLVPHSFSPLSTLKCVQFAQDR